MDIVQVFLAVLLVNVYCVASFGIFNSGSHDQSTLNLGKYVLKAGYLSTRIIVI